MTANPPRVSPLRRVLLEAAAGWAPPPDISPVDWGEANIVLGREWSARPGPWRSARTPYVREPLNRYSLRDPVRRIVLQWAAQTGKTTSVILVKDGYVIAVRPRPMMTVRPKAEDCKDFSKREVAGIIRSSRVLSELVSKPKSRDRDSTLQNIAFRGGRWYIRTAASPTEMASIAVGDLDIDEVDRMGESSGTEGDPVDLAITRAMTFPTRKVTLTSTPGLEASSRIEQALHEGDLRHYWVPCPRCGERQVLVWAQVRWEREAPGAAWYVCTHCGGRIEHHEKAAMLAAGEWRPMDHGQTVGECTYCRERMGHDGPHVPSDPDTASYHLSGLYSPWESWGEIVRLFLAAQGDRDRMTQWTNTRMAETWRETFGEGIDYDPLLLRREQYQSPVPPGVIVLTAGVDVQPDRYEVEVVGWGAGEESWSIDYLVIPGDTSLPDAQALLDELVTMRYDCGGGKTLPIAAACLDTGGTGGATQAAYDYVRRHARSGLRVWGVKGRAVESGQRDKVWPKQPSIRRTRGGGAVQLYVIRVDTAKDTVYSRLQQPEVGPGYCHFPSREPYNRAYFRGLTAEIRKEKKHQGRTIYVWHLPAHRRNEPLDCRVMAYAALEGLKENRLVDLTPKRGPVTPRRPGPRIADAGAGRRSDRSRGGFGTRRSLF